MTHPTLCSHWRTCMHVACHDFRLSKATAKLARCRCKPSHINPGECPEYKGV